MKFAILAILVLCVGCTDIDPGDRFDDFDDRVLDAGTDAEPTDTGPQGAE